MVGTAVTIQAAGQVLTGDVAVERTAAGMHVTAARVRLLLGDGTPPS